LEKPYLIYLAIFCVALLIFRFYQGIMRRRREEKAFERSQDLVHSRTKRNTATAVQDGRKRGIARRIGLRRKGSRRKKNERRSSSRREEVPLEKREGDNLRESERRGNVRRFLDRRKSDRRNRERRK